jgi:hypothetical protein
MTTKEFIIGERGTLLICAALIAAIFVLDASTPSGYSACFLYILPLFFCLGLANDRTIYGVALIASVLTIIAVPFEPSGTLSIDLFNRPIAIAGIWIVVFIGMQRRRFERDIEKKALELARFNLEMQQFKESHHQNLGIPRSNAALFVSLLTCRLIAAVVKLECPSIFDRRNRSHPRRNHRRSERVSQ